MKANFNNSVTIEGKVYQHDLSVKTVQNKESANFGKEYIGGTIDVATDDAGLNVLTVRYSYVTPVTKSGKENISYKNLKKIVDEGKTVVEHGLENATKVKLSTAAGLLDFYNSEDELVSIQINEGGFASIVNNLHEEKQRNTFTFDTVIIGSRMVEKEDDDPYLELKCAVFNFRNEILPYTLIAKNPAAIKYFEGFENLSTKPLFTKVWGNIVCKTIKTERVTESAFGDAAVDVVEKRSREWVVTGAAAEPYDFGTEDTITAEDLKKAMADREVKLAEAKQRTEEWRAAQNGGAAKTAIPEGGFQF